MTHVFDRFCKHYPIIGTLVFSLIVAVSITTGKQLSFHIPPLLLAALRIGFLFPLIFFLKRPVDVSIWRHITVGLLLSLGYYGAFYTALFLGALPGTATLFYQLSIPFTIMVSISYLNLWPHPYQMLGTGIILLGVSGVALSMGIMLPHANIWPILICLSIAVIGHSSWQLFFKKHINANQSNHIVWQCTLTTPILLILSYCVEGPTSMVNALTALSLMDWGILMLLCVIGTLLNGAYLMKLLHYHNPAIILPITAIIPFFVLIISFLMFGERLSLFQALSGLLIMVGIYITQKYRATAKPIGTTVQSAQQTAR